MLFAVLEVFVSSAPATAIEALYSRLALQAFRYPLRVGILTYVRAARGLLRPNLHEFGARDNLNFAFLHRGFPNGR